MFTPQRFTSLHHCVAIFDGVLLHKMKDGTYGKEGR